MLTVYELCTESAVPDGLVALPDIAVDKCQPPMASIPPSPEEQVLVLASKFAYSMEVNIETGTTTADKINPDVYCLWS